VTIAPHTNICLQLFFLFRHKIYCQKIVFTINILLPTLIEDLVRMPGGYVCLKARITSYTLGTWRLTRLFTVCRLNERQVGHQRGSDARESALEQSAATGRRRGSACHCCNHWYAQSAHLIFQQFPRCGWCVMWIECLLLDQIHNWNSFVQDFVLNVEYLAALTKNYTQYTTKYKY
jgi:hypothetical protein